MAGRLLPVRLRSLTVSACAALLLAVVTVLALATPMPTVAAQEDNPGKGLAKGHAKGVVIVGYEPGTSKVKRGQAAVSVEATDVTAISPLAPNTVVMELPPGQTVEEAIAELEQQPGVRYAEPDYYVDDRPRPRTTPTTRTAASGACTATPASPAPTSSDRAPPRPGPLVPSARQRVYVGVIDDGRPDHPPGPAPQHVDQPVRDRGTPASTTTATATSTTSTAGTSSTTTPSVYDGTERRRTAPTWPARSAPAEATASAWPVSTGT